VIDDCQHGHKAPFARIAKRVGLEGKMTATHAGKTLAQRLNALAAEIGPYPHASLDMSQVKKQGTRLIKLVCADCGYTVRTTAKWIEIGLPTCACGEEMEVAQ
jgi:predicted peroxiredoxin